MSGGGVLSYQQTGLEVGRVPFFFLRCNKKRTADVFVLLLRHAANDAVALFGGGVLSYQQTGLEVGRVLSLFLRCNKKRTADVFVFFTQTRS